MLKHFIKYQSLGNDFILYDWYKKPAVFVQKALGEVGWPSFVKEVCDRHFGIGADGVLIVKSSTESSFPEMLIFNADGSQAEMCMNGVRCVAHYLFTRYAMPKAFKIKVGQRDVDCSLVTDKNNPDLFSVVTNVGSASYQEKVTLNVAGSSFEGHVISVGNPHVVIFQKVEQAWLLMHGKAFECHERFPTRTNVEFVWEDQSVVRPQDVHKVYRLLVYERGCGMTLACSSGAAATLWALFHSGTIKQDESVALAMQGGIVIGYIDAGQNIVLRAAVSCVFDGDLAHKE